MFEFTSRWGRYKCSCISNTNIWLFRGDLMQSSNRSAVRSCSSALRVVKIPPTLRLLFIRGIRATVILLFRTQTGRSHGVEEQRAVLLLSYRALWQGTASPQITGDDFLVQAQLAGDAVKRLRVQIQDGGWIGESRRSEVPELPLTGKTGGDKEEED